MRHDNTRVAGTPWDQRPLIIVAACLLLFPVGVMLLVRSRWPRAAWKLPLAIGSGAVFLAILACGAGLHVRFDGNVVPQLDWFSRSRHEEHLARQRQAQRTAPMPDLPPVRVEDPARQWPAFRGRYRDGVVRSGPLALPWSGEGPRQLWSQPIGGGHGSVAVADERIFTLEQRGDDEVVAAYHLETGRELWTHRYAADFQERMGGPGPRATPAVDADRVYSIGATGVLVCLDATAGTPVWSRNTLTDAGSQNLEWGMAGSPLVHAEKVYAAPGGSGSAVIAYDAGSGEILWKSGAHKGGYASPMLARLLDVPHLLVLDGDGLSAYAPESGHALWHFPWKTAHDVNAGQPLVVDDRRIYISAGYGHGGALIEVERHEGQFNVKPLWSNTRLKLKFSSAVLHDGHIYGLDERILTCLDVQTGQRRWKGGRYGYGQLILAGGYLLIQCEDGDLALVEATPLAHREISRVSALGSKTWNHPAVSGGKLVVRNDRQMICFDLSPP